MKFRFYFTQAFRILFIYIGALLSAQEQILPVKNLSYREFDLSHKIRIIIDYCVSFVSTSLA